MIHTDEDDEFERIEHENKMKGQPYHYEPVYVSASQRNQVLEEAAKLAEVWELPLFAEEIRSLKK
jgi:hypothetical protein